MIYLGADHGGFELKAKIKDFLDKKGIEYEDMGNLQYEKTDDYPIYAFRVAKAVAQNNDSKGILICRSAAGMMIAANKVKGVKAVAVVDEKSAKHAVEHNNANIIGLSGDWMTEQQAKNAVQLFLMTKFTGEERHFRRLKIIEEYEK